MKKAGIKILIILLSLMVTSCGVSPVENAQDIPTAVTDTAVSVNLPTQTSEPPVPSASPIPTKTITPTVVVPTVPVPTPTWESPLPDIEVKVVEIITSSLDTNRVKGLLAYLDYSDSKNYLFNLSTGEKTLLSEKNAAFFSCGPVSPDRRSLLCQAGDQGGLLLDRQAQIVGRFSWPYEWVYAAGWVNNEWLAFVTRSPQDYPNLLNSPTTLLDLTTQKARLVIPDYPDISILEPFGNIGPLAFTGVSYGPDLELAIYEGYDAEGATWILWDQKAEQKTASIFQAEQMPYPQWSPDGQQAAVAGSDVPYAQKQSDTELYLLSRSNGTQKLTQLGDSFQKFTQIWGLGWSPDGKQLAFLLKSDQSACSSNGCIGIIDVETKKLKLFRFQAYGISFPYEPSFNLIWSPDSRQLLLELYSEAAQSSSIVVFEVEKETAFPVMTTDVRILGWMAEEGQ